MSTQMKANPIPLTRWEKRVLAAARAMGMAAFGELRLLATNDNIARDIAGLTDNQRHWLFYKLEEFVQLLSDMRGEN